MACVKYAAEYALAPFIAIILLYLLMPFVLIKWVKDLVYVAFRRGRI